MIKLDNTFINAEITDVLQLLKQELIENDTERFETIKSAGNNVQTNCPFHKDGQERKPSFGINIHNGVCHCFTCGWAGSLDLMISQLYQKDDFGKYGKSWLLKRFNSTILEERTPLNLDLTREKKVSTKEIISELELDSYRYIHPYMYTRGLTDELIERFDIGYDSKTNCITFPIRDLQGDCIYVARRSVQYKFFNYPEGVNKPLYLGYLFVKGEYEYAVICESFLNALTCWKFGIPAIALIGLGSASQYELLRKLPVRKYILALDPDIRGRNAQEKLRKELKNSKVLSEWVYRDLRDLNDLQEEILNLREIY